MQKLQSTGVLSSKFFERLSLVELSDPKCIDEIGTKKRADGRLRTTYLKLSAIDLEALRLALHNPETRLCIGEVLAAVHTRIQRIVVTASGFLGHLAIAWNDDLNRITSVWGEEPRVVEVDSEKPVAIDPSDLLGPSGGPTILGQREIYAVSASEEYRLALLDELIGEEAHTRANAVQEAIEH